MQSGHCSRVTIEKVVRTGDRHSLTAGRSGRQTRCAVGERRPPLSIREARTEGAHPARIRTGRRRSGIRPGGLHGEMDALLEIDDRDVLWGWIGRQGPARRSDAPSSMDLE